MTNVYFSLPVLHHDSFSYTQQPAPASQVNNSKSWVPQRILIIVPHHLGKKVKHMHSVMLLGFTTIII